MLAEFQQALVDLTGSPELCLSVRADESVLRNRYRLTDRELRRLLGIVRHRGMECACTIYRANRLVPLALNVPGLCRAFGKDLRAVASEYWAAYPEANVHFYAEANRFCGFVAELLNAGRKLAPQVAVMLEAEKVAVAEALAASYIEGRE